ncbi:MAG: hypothetical protein JRN62_03415 [Nitrososphaerota archaeon]|nr:hypothetical protein [Nitrososphaerota archaeon]MDG6948647.1 hypothetical protein [Nitrososphaerota archaeon]
MKVNGSVNYLFIYDVGDEIDLESIKKSHLTTPVDLKWSTLKPKYVAVKPAPLLVHFGKEHVVFYDIPMSDGNVADVDVVVKAYAVGAISVSMVVPFTGKDLADIPKYDETKVKTADGNETTFKAMANDVVKRVTSKVGEYISDPRSETEPEEYTTFCISDSQIDERYIANDSDLRQTLAKIINGDKTTTAFSDDQVANALKQHVSYYENDAVFVDWSSAVVIDRGGDFGDVLFVIELANLQLLEMRYYDAVLDRLVDKASKEVKKRSGLKALILGYGNTARKIAAQKLEVNAILEATKNYTKFVGDWYLARVYNSLAERLRLKDWDATLGSKLKILEDFYELVTGQVEGRRNTILEVVIVALIVGEIAMSYYQWSYLPQHIPVSVP